MNKVTISDYSLIIVQTSDEKFLLIDKKEPNRIANNLKELIEIIRGIFEEGK